MAAIAVGRQTADEAGQLAEKFEGLLLFSLGLGVSRILRGRWGNLQLKHFFLRSILDHLAG